jgi:hypothetical protein
MVISCRSLSIVFGFAAILAGVQMAQSQTQTPPTQPQPATSSPATNAYAPPQQPGPLATSQLTPLRLAARMTEKGEEITRGMIWRVFQPEAGQDGKLPLVAQSQGGVAVFELLPGTYLVHAAFGRAGATKRITLGKDAKREEVVLDAGGLQLNALLAGGKPIPSSRLKFSIYEAKPDLSGDRALIVRDVEPQKVVRLNAGTYHIVSEYGAVNAVVRSDVVVEAGKLTEAMVEHKAAQVTLKLVREKGAEAMAETSWSVLTDSGDPILETVGPYATVVLAEGQYTVVAKNRDRIFQNQVTVESGQDSEVEVLADSTTEIDPNEGAD